MDRSLDVGHVAETLPSLDGALDDSRLRPVGAVGGVVLLLAGVALSLTPATVAWAFWANALAATLVFVGVPLFCLGLAAPDPPSDSLFHVGVDLSAKQRRAVALGSLCIVLAPIVMAAGSPLGISVLVLATAATMAFVGAALVLTGFIAWTAETLAEPS
ncbi:hypothetical protein [Haloarcula litorea]|uniref:hypothetical protein n=1 Tax=Haloarcula litorea TaxID=3032579 RepID=UPI0023E8EB3F|nr:hypothetical protein [Halomicroarcula sp. GDY20]